MYGRHNMKRSYSTCVLSNAQELRHNMTDSERALWAILRQHPYREFHFRRQVPYERYILDFYSFLAKLVIEIDGPIHERKRTMDSFRDEYFIDRGYTVLRLTNEEIVSHMDLVEHKLNKVLGL